MIVWMIKNKNLGLMFKKKDLNRIFLFYYYEKEPLIIHTFFVFHKLDIIFVDKNFKILEIRRNVKPFTPVIAGPKEAQHFLEVASDVNFKAQVGDYVNLVKDL